jgi:hypothetical protein
MVDRNKQLSCTERARLCCRCRNLAETEVEFSPEVFFISAGNMTMNGMPYKPGYKVSVYCSGHTRKYILPYTRCLSTSFPSKWGLIRLSIALLFLIYYSSETLLLNFMSFYNIFSFSVQILEWEKRNRLMFELNAVCVCLDTLQCEIAP